MARSGQSYPFNHLEKASLERMAGVEETQRPFWETQIASALAMPRPFLVRPGLLSEYSPISSSRYNLEQYYAFPSQHQLQGMLKTKV